MYSSITWGETAGPFFGICRGAAAAGRGILSCGVAVIMLYIERNISRLNTILIFSKHIVHDHISKLASSIPPHGFYLPYLWLLRIHEV